MYSRAAVRAVFTTPSYCVIIMTRNSCSSSSSSSSRRMEKKKKKKWGAHHPRLFRFLAGLCLFAVTAYSFLEFLLFHSSSRQHARVAWIMTLIDPKNASSSSHAAQAILVDLLFSTPPPSPAAADSGTTRSRVVVAPRDDDNDNQRHYNNDTAAAAAAATTTYAAGDETMDHGGEEQYLWNGECGNTPAWLRAPRHGNLRDDPLFTDDLARSLLVLDLPGLLVSEQGGHLLGQTLCHAGGRFRRTAVAAGRRDGEAWDERTVRLWAVRLVYYALHYHQHRLAAPEATQRYRHYKYYNNTRGKSTTQTNDDDSNTTTSTCSPQALLQRHNVGVFDYECPRAKYIIVSLGGNGIGANVRGAMVPAFLAGLTSDRIVLFVNRAAARGGDPYLTRPWPLASCPRQDHQCFFLPVSPCALTVDEIAAAHRLGRPEYRRLTKRSDPLPEIQHHKVWSYASQFLPNEFVGRRAVTKLQEYAQIFVDAVPATPDHARFAALLRRAVHAIADMDGPRPGTTYNFAARWSRIHHALALYAVRPNPGSAAKLQRIMADIVPDRLDPETTFGLPVRASDKCRKESECLSFAEHMTATTRLWERHLNETRGGHLDPTVVFTTEAKSVVQEQQSWVQANDPSKLPFQFDFVVNERDILPGSGFISDVGLTRNQGMESDPDANMLSSMSSLKLQLLPRVSMGNCCSNFHALLSDFLMEGCGAASDNTFVCLQEIDDPLLRVCCGWHRDCIAKRKAYRTVLENNGTTEEAYAAAFTNAVWDPKTNQLRPIEPATDE